MKRREFVGGLAGTVAWPLAASAQQPERMRHIAVFLNLPEGDAEGERSVVALRHGMEDLGWIEGRNIRIEYRWSPGADTSRIRAMAFEIVSGKPDLILASHTEVLTAFREATGTIPIVFVSVSDPVAQGFVSNMAQPGANITGFTAFEFSMGGKWIQTLKEIAPGIAKVGVIFNPKTAPYHASFMAAIESASASFGVQSLALPLNDVGEIEPAIIKLAREQNVGVIFPSDGFNWVYRKTLIPLVAQHRIPAIYAWRQFALDGGLIAYGIDGIDPYRRAASYIDQVLRGTRPGDLPIQQPTKFELIINLKTAKALGLTVPVELLRRADEVIE
jgi:putative ABC transport system substrate-binding protein